MPFGKDKGKKAFGNISFSTTTMDIVDQKAEEEFIKDQKEKDSSEQKVINPKIYESLPAPKLMKWERDEVRSFYKKRRIYVAEMQQFDSGESRILPLRLSLSDRLQGAFCDFVLGKDFEEVTDSDIENKMDEFLTEDLPGNVEEIHRINIQRSLRMNYRLHPDEMVYKFFEDYQEILESKNLLSFVQNHPQLAIKHLTACLHPPVLREQVKGALLKSPDEGKDLNLREFFKLVSYQMKIIAPVLSFQRRKVEDAEYKRKMEDKRAFAKEKTNKGMANRKRNLQKTSATQGVTNSNKSKQPSKKKGQSRQDVIICYFCKE